MSSQNCKCKKNSILFLPFSALPEITVYEIFGKKNWVKETLPAYPDIESVENSENYVRFTMKNNPRVWFDSDANYTNLMLLNFPGFMEILAKKGYLPDPLID